MASRKIHYFLKDSDQFPFFDFRRAVERGPTDSESPKSHGGWRMLRELGLVWCGEEEIKGQSKSTL